MNLKNIEFIQADSIKINKGTKELYYDLTVDAGDNSFYLVKEDKLYLVHNCDGGHITALLVNLFFKWFPYIIDEGSLYRLKIPLISVGDGKKREFFFSQEGYNTWQKGKRTPGSVRFLKGLGSLAEEDWEVIMNNKQLQQIRRDPESQRYLEMAFGKDALPRKKWLRGEFK